MRRTFALSAVAVVLLAASAAQAQVIDQIRQGVEKGIDRVVEGAAKRYSLDEQQAAQAKKLFLDRTNDYLDKNGEKIEKLVADLKDRFQPGQIPNPDDLKDAIKQVLPLLQDTRKHFNESAGQFRNILNDNQKTTFDDDKARLDQGADQVFKALESGDPLQALFALRGAGGLGGAFGGGFGGGQQQTRLAFTGAGFLEAEWDRWLERSSKVGKFTDEQLAKSKEILKLGKEAAAEYRRAKEADIKAVGEMLRAARRDREKRAEAEKAAEELSKPLLEIAKKWQGDVLALLSEEQRKAVEAANRRPGQ